MLHMYVQLANGSAIYWGMANCHARRRVPVFRRSIFSFMMFGAMIVLNLMSVSSWWYAGKQAEIVREGRRLKRHRWSSRT